MTSNRCFRRPVLVGAAASALALLLAAYLLCFKLFGSPTFDPSGLQAYYQALAVRPSEPADVRRVRAGIESAAGYIKRASEASGRFTYLVNVDPKVPIVPGYSLLRHAGTIYSLGMLHAIHPDAEVALQMKLAVEFMRSCCYAQLHDRDMLAIWEPESVVHSPTPPEYKLGAVGLGLAALVSLEKVMPGSVPPAEMRRIARTGQFLQRWNGQFYSKYLPSQGRRVQPDGVLFYPGEMALGWLMLHEHEPSPHLVAATIEALAFLARQRAKAGVAPADHWALLATAKLFRIADREHLDIPRDLLLNHALQICHTVLEEAHGPARLPAMEGSLVSSGHGQTTPTATRLEGLLAALTFLPASNPITAHVKSAVHRGMDFVLRAQLKVGPHRGGMPMAIARLPEDGSAATARFNIQATEIRIDYVQHAMSAMLQYLELSSRWKGPDAVSTSSN